MSVVRQKAGMREEEVWEGPRREDCVLGGNEGASSDVVRAVNQNGELDSPEADSRTCMGSWREASTKSCLSSRRVKVLIALIGKPASQTSMQSS